jgi:KRAB domain-containing zinc finger protein
MYTRVHTEERPYECRDCGKSFKHAWNVTEHWKIHSGEKPYERGECGKFLMQRHVLKEHKKIHSEKGLMSVENVGSPLSEEVNLLSTRWYTL